MIFLKLIPSLSDV